MLIWYMLIWYMLIWYMLMGLSASYKRYAELKRTLVDSSECHTKNVSVKSSTLDVSNVVTDDIEPSDENTGAVWGRDLNKSCSTARFEGDDGGAGGAEVKVDYTSSVMSDWSRKLQVKASLQPVRIL